LLVCAIAWSAYTIAEILPRWPVDPWFAGSPWYNFDFDFTRALRAIFLPTLLWGASFPLALAGVARPGTDPARFSGEVYAINTLGSILGALLFSLAAIPGLGTRGSQEVLIGLSAVAAIVALLAARPAMPILAGGGIATVLLAIVLSQSLADVPWQVFAFGRRVAPKMREMELAPAAGAYNLLYSAEGLNSSIAIAERAGERSFYVSGKSEASTTSLDMRLQRLMGHLPALLHRAPKSVLVVGFGAGVTAGSFVPYREIEKIAICELEPLIPPASNEYFAAQNYRVLNDPRTTVIYDDARHYIATARDQFDIITTDPIHPFVKGTSTLYSKEYYELAKQHLNPGGIVAQWLPIYDSDAESVKTQLATFFSVFPSGTVWSNNLNGDGYDLVLIGRAEESAIDLARMQQRLTGPVAESLSQVGWDSATELAATYAGRAQDLSGALQGAQINTDLNLRLQYLAGLGLDSMSAAATYQELMSYFPEGLFTATPDVLDGLKSKLGRRRRVF